MLFDIFRRHITSVMPPPDDISMPFFSPLSDAISPCPADAFEPACRRRPLDSRHATLAAYAAAEFSPTHMPRPMSPPMFSRERAAPSFNMRGVLSPAAPIDCVPAPPPEGCPMPPASFSFSVLSGAMRQISCPFSAILMLPSTMPAHAWLRF